MTGAPKTVEPKGRWVLRPRRLARAFWLPGLYLFLGGVVLALLTWWAAHGLGLETGSGLRAGATLLQLLGAVVVVSGLWRRGTVFGRPTPLTHLRRFAREVRGAFYRPPSTVLDVHRATHGHFSMSGRAEVEARPASLEGRVRALELMHEDLKVSLKEHRKETAERMTKLREELGTTRTDLRESIKEVRTDIEAGIADGLGWEWIGLAWILLGLGGTVVAELGLL